MFTATVQCYKVVRLQLLVSLVNLRHELRGKLKKSLDRISLYSYTYYIIMFMNSTTILHNMRSLQFVILFNAVSIVRGEDASCHKIFNN